MPNAVSNYRQLLIIILPRSYIGLVITWWQMWASLIVEYDLLMTDWPHGPRDSTSTSFLLSHDVICSWHSLSYFRPSVPQTKSSTCDTRTRRMRRESWPQLVKLVTLVTLSICRWVENGVKLISYPIALHCGHSNRFYRASAYWRAILV